MGGVGGGGRVGFPNGVCAQKPKFVAPFFGTVIEVQTGSRVTPLSLN